MTSRERIEMFWPGGGFVFMMLPGPDTRGRSPEAIARSRATVSTRP